MRKLVKITAKYGGSGVTAMDMGYGNSTGAGRQLAQLLALLTLLVLPATLPASKVRGRYVCAGGRELSVSALRALQFLDNHQVEMELSGARRPVHFLTTYRIAGDELYIHHDHKAVFIFQITGETLRGMSHPYEDRTCKKEPG